MLKSMVTTRRTAAIRPIHRSSLLTSGASRKVSRAASAKGMSTSRPRNSAATTKAIRMTFQMATSVSAAPALALGDCISKGEISPKDVLVFA